MAEYSDISESISDEKMNDSGGGGCVVVTLTEEIIKLLHLEDNENKDEIVNDLLENGREALQNHQRDITPEVYEREMNNQNSELLQLLKKYVKQQWKTQYCSLHEWFRLFLEEHEKEDTFVLYESIVLRTAEHGNKYMKQCPLLSIVIQLLFDSIDDDCLKQNPSIFDDLWITITNNGLKSIQKYSSYISEEVKNQQITKTNKALFMGLCEYFRQPLFNLLKGSKVIDRDKLYNFTLDNVAEHGWLDGVEQIRKKVAPVLFELLLHNINLFRENQQKENIMSKEATSNVNNCSLVFNAPLSTVTTVTILDQISDNQSISGSSINFSQQQKLSSSIDNLPSTMLQNSTILSASTLATVKVESQIPSSSINNEIEIIKTCIINRFQLEDLVKAGELMYINKTLKNISDKILEDYCKSKDYSAFINDCLTPIMYLLKRTQNLDDFIKTLLIQFERMKRTNRQITIRTETETTNLSLRMFLHVLFMNSDLFLRRVIMSLISKRNPVPFLEPNALNWSQNEPYEFISDIIHVWNYSRPTVLSFGIGPCQGKSSLLNQLFQSTFEEKIDNSLYFQQTIDIDFGYCFNPKRSLNIADTHGELHKLLVRKLVSIFDGFLIHIDQIYLSEHLLLLVEYLELLPEEKFQMVLVRDISNKSEEQCLLTIKSFIETKASEHNLSKRLHIYPLENVSNINDRKIILSIEDLREEILTKMNNEIKIMTDIHKSQITLETRKEKIVFDIQKLFKKDYVSYLTHMDDIIQPMKNKLLQRNKHKHDQIFRCIFDFKNNVN
ncbi:unnamed protein product [Didymodactylos carnosus]|uniref:Uncharacterized protein n=1 Tax=Didymodactylos carnosus TaxID=1234261 RepID=A0A814LPQ1_9BILA|nr:unnamed protein product [Didymodactylos carnosus]CAF1067058.1 unnamed protein product [Didymodactylos carnosus]CAF3691409.1 unnamed protein product [Didymodactylos carnosus]CAF3834618.1 unnamed protein product [Didymodactylos carnosus]